MKPLILGILFGGLVWATSYTSTTSGNWNVASTWGGAGVPGNGDTATIADGTTVTCPFLVICIAGTSTPGATAITIGQGTANPSTAKLVVAGVGTLTVRGNMVVNEVSNVRTPGYCALTLGPGSIWNFDSSLTSPTSTRYSYSTAGSFMTDAVICSNGSSNPGDSTGPTVGGNHVTIQSSSLGGNGFISTSSYSAWEHSFTYTDFINVGDANNPAIAIYGSASSTVQLFNLDHSTFSNYGGVLMSGLNSDSNFTITHNIWNGHNAPSLGFCVNWSSPPTPDGLSVRTIAYNTCDSQWANSAQDPTWTGITFHDNFGGWAFPPQDNTTGPWAQFTNNVMVADWGNDGGGANSPGAQVNSQGDIDGLYLLYHTNIGHWHWLQGMSGAITRTTKHVIFDSDVTINNCTGNDGWFLGDISTTTGVTYPFTYSIVLPPAIKGCSPGGIFQGLAIHPNNPSAVFDHDTDFAQQGLNMGDNDGYTGEVSQLTNTLFWIPESYKNIASQQYSSDQTAGFKASDVGTAGGGGRPPGICVVDLLIPSGAHNNAGFNIRQLPGASATQCTNTSADGNGYWGAYSSTPGTNDIAISDPLFVDYNRNLHTYDIGGLSHPVATAWSSSATYHVGDLVSHSVSAYINGITINYRCIKAHTGTGISGATNSLGVWSSVTAYNAGDIVSYGTLPVSYIARTSTTNNQPDVSPTQWSLNYEPGSIGENLTAGWRDFWEPATFNDLRNSLYSYTSGTSPIVSMQNWVTAGFAPQNRALCNGASDGTQIGAVPCPASVPLKLTGPTTCQQGQTCQYTANSGTPPYTYTLMAGSTGSINAVTGAYTAPSHITPHQLINGCSALPNNNVFNTRIDTMPVHPNNALWMSNVTTGNASFESGQKMVGSVVNSTDQSVGMQFDYTNNPAITVSSYAELNGEFHHWNTFDAAYLGLDPYGFHPGMGDPTVSLSPLSFNVGYLTDGIIGRTFPYSDGSTPYTVTGGSWSGGTTTITIGTHTLQTGDWVAVYGAVSSPSGEINTSIVQLTGVTGTTISYPLGVGSGTWVSGGTVQKLLAESAQLPEWMGWALACACGSPDDTNDVYATVTFTFPNAVQLTSIQVYAANLDSVWSSAGVNVPNTITVSYSNDGVTFSNDTTYTTTSADRNIQFSGWITVPLSNLNAYKYVQVHMTHLDNWIYVSEIKFAGNAVPFIFQPFPFRVSQAGAAWTPPGNWQEPDNHYLTTYKDTCQQQENYKYYTQGVYSGILGNFPNAASGMLYPLNSNSLSGIIGQGVGINAAGLYITPLTYRRDELIASEAGDVNAIKHATLVTLGAGSLNEAAFVWPAQAAASGGCGTNCMPYGSRLRLKSTFSYSGPWNPACGTACQNIIQAVIQQQKNYGVMVTDAGTEFEGDGTFGYTNYDVYQAVQQSHSILILNSTNYEIVNEASLQTSQDQTSLDPAWLEAKINNGLVTPDGAAVIKVTDSNSNTAFFSVSLQGVGIGVERDSELVMAGASPWTLQPWITGSTNTAFTCTLSPSGGSFGTITSGCLYVPPVSVASLTNTTITVTASADSSVTKTVNVTIIPTVSNKSFMSTGKIVSSGTPSYTDTSGNVWWNDMTQGLPLSFFPEEQTNDYSYGFTFTDYPGTNYYSTAPHIFDTYITDLNDHVFDIHVPNGVVTGTIVWTPFNGSTPPTAANQSGFGLDCNGAVIMGQTDGFSWTGGGNVSRPLSCTQVVSNSLLHMVVRLQGPGSSPSTFPGCSIPCYNTPAATQSLIAGLVISSSSSPGSLTSITTTGAVVLKGRVALQ